MAKKIKQYPSKRQIKKGVRGSERRVPMVKYDYHGPMSPQPWETKREADKALKIKKTRPTHDPMKELNKTIKSGGGGGVGGGRWHKDPKTGRRTWKIL